MLRTNVKLHREIILTSKIKYIDNAPKANLPTINRNIAKGAS